MDSVKSAKWSQMRDPKIDVTTKIKRFFSFLSLTPFEKDLIEAVEQNLSAEQRKIFRDQLSRLNRLGFCLEPNPENPNHYGYTEFYWKRFGKSILDFPAVFPGKRTDKKWAIVKTRCGANEIIATFTMVRGGFFSIEYRSPTQLFYPDGPYEIASVEILL